MILNGSAQVLLNLKKKKKSIKIDPGTQNKTWYVKWNKTITAYNTSFCAIWCVMEDWKAILTGLGQYCFSVLHNTWYPTQWSAIIV